MIRVGRFTYDKNNNIQYPSLPNYSTILIMPKSVYWDLSSEYMRDENGVIMENRWQFSKVYPYVPYVLQRESKFSKNIIWENKEEIHVDDNNNINSNYINWRKKGMMSKHPIEYPVGYNHRRTCLYTLKENNDGTYSDKLDFIEARKKIYVPEYCKLVKKKSKFKELQIRHQKEENLLIIAKDGPKQESLPYYIGRYNVKKDFIYKDTVLVNRDTIQIMLNDQKHKFGFGFCISMAILGKDETWLHGNAITYELPKIVPILQPIRVKIIRIQHNKREQVQKLQEGKKFDPNEKLEKKPFKSYKSSITRNEKFVDAGEYDIMKDFQNMIQTDLNKNTSFNSKEEKKKIKDIVEHAKKIEKIN
jgi:hypothetical protein